MPTLKLYGVTTRRLNEQVRRNTGRFPEDFCVSADESGACNLDVANATSSRNPHGHGGRRKKPLVFTEHGSIMAASVLNSSRAVEVSVFVVRAFVKLREILASNKALAHKLNELERKLTTHDRAITELIEAIRQLMTPPETKKKRPIGFAPWGKE